jgi:hypothetical protein
MRQTKQQTITKNRDAEALLVNLTAATQSNFFELGWILQAVTELLIIIAALL